VPSDSCSDVLRNTRRATNSLAAKRRSARSERVDLAHARMRRRRELHRLAVRLRAAREVLRAAHQDLAQTAGARDNQARGDRGVLHKAAILVGRVLRHAQVILADGRDGDLLAVRGDRDFDGILAAGLEVCGFGDDGVLAQLTHHAAVILVNEHDLAVLAPGLAVGREAAAGGVVGRVVPALLVAAGVGRRGSVGTLQKRGALREDGLEGVDVVLRDAVADAGELDAREGAALEVTIPSRDQVARGWLVVDLCSCGERKVELGREVEVEVEVLVWNLVLWSGGAEIGEWGGGRDHEE